MSLEEIAKYYENRVVVTMTFQSEEEFIERVLDTYKRIYGGSCPVL